MGLTFVQVHCLERIYKPYLGRVNPDRVQGNNRVDKIELKVQGEQGESTEEERSAQQALQICSD